MRIWIIALAALMVLPAVGAAATIVTRPVDEQLVEGHTVFTVIEVVRNTTTAREEFHAAVAVLVQDKIVRNEAFRFPGVLWFNDQYLVNPESSAKRQVQVRYPCTGSVMAVDASYPGDPRTEFNAGIPVYVESYYITDPNDRVWNVDKWRGDGGFIWTVAIKDNQAGYNTPDNGTCNSAPYRDISSCTLPGGGSGSTTPGPSGGICKYRYYDPGRHDTNANGADIGMGYPCGQDGVNNNCPNLLYNALLYFRMNDLAAADAGTPKDHKDGSLDRQRDVSGCHPDYGNYAGYSGTTDRWPCPWEDTDGDGVVDTQNDNREGNSHAYNPELPWPLATYDGRLNHGGSADCDGDGVADQPPGRTDYNADYMCHATQNIRVYYHYNPAPTLRTYYLMDIEGSSAPYHCHDSMAVCNLGEANAAYANDWT